MPFPDESVPASDRGAGPLADRLTVVLLTYNCANWVRDTLTHLRDLRLPLVAVDNGSTDATREILADFPDVRVVALGRNTGAAGRNAGVEAAHTDYVLFCDDDGWYERDGLDYAVRLLDQHPDLALINARILVGEQRYLDPISVEMADSPLPDRHGLPGAVLLSFMAGASLVRRTAYLQVGGYDERFFIGGEEETLAIKLARMGWQMRYLPEVVMHHYPSTVNAPRLRHWGMRNTIVNAWLHRPLGSALRWTAFTLADAPKNRDLLRALGMLARDVPWIVRERRPMARDLDEELLVLNRRRFADRRRLFTVREQVIKDPSSWGTGTA